MPMAKPMNDEQVRAAMRRLVDDEMADPRWRSGEGDGADPAEEGALLGGLRQGQRPVTAEERVALTRQVLQTLARREVAPVLSLGARRRRVVTRALAPVSGLLAAGLLLFVTYQVEHNSRPLLPAYQVSLGAGGSSDFRRIDEASPAGALKLAPGVESHLFLRPEQRVSTAVTARAFLRRSGAALIEQPTQRVMPGQAGNLHLYLRLDPARTSAGRWELLMFIGAEGDLPKDAEAALQAAERPRDGARLLRQPVEIP